MGDAGGVEYGRAVVAEDFFFGRVFAFDREGAGGGAGGAFVVGHPQSDDDAAARRVDLARRRRRPGAGLEGPVAVEVPFVFGDRAVGVAGGRGIEAHRFADFGRERRGEARFRPFVGAVAVEVFVDRRGF